MSRDKPGADGLMRILGAVIVAGLMVACSTTARAQDQPPPIGPVAIDLHGSVLSFPTDQTLADSRGLSTVELPSLGLGVNIGLHFYPARWHGGAIGFGAQVALARGHRTPAQNPANPASASARAVTEQFASFAPQISFNFGTGDGWSYLSGGIGLTQWSISPDGNDALPPDVEHLKTINYGGGARWFIKPRLAFSLDVRFYAINPGTPVAGYPGSARATQMIAGAGISIK
jgi:hypothetical protein